MNNMKEFPLVINHVHMIVKSVHLFRRNNENVKGQ